MNFKELQELLYAVGVEADLNNEPLGRGGFSIVYDGNFLRGKPTAIKLMCPPTTDQARHSIKDIKDVFEKDISTQEKVSSHTDAVIRVYDFFFSGNLMFALLEKGSKDVSLESIVSESELYSLPEKMRLLRNIAHSIGEVHSLGYVHCDIKPENIIFEDSAKREQETLRGRNFLVIKGRPKLTDFGGALPINAENKKDNIVGTPEYLCPDRFKSEKIDHRWDIFSFGVIAYRLLFNEFPFDVSFTRGIYRFKELPLNIDLGKELWPITNPIKKMLSLEPDSSYEADNRYPSVRELIEDLKFAENYLLEEKIFTLRRYPKHIHCNKANK